MQEEAEKTYRLLETDFRDALASKDEEIRKVKAESRLIQKELEDQLRASLKEPAPAPTTSMSHTDYMDAEKVRRLKNEISILKDQNRKLLNELQVGTTGICNFNPKGFKLGEFLSSGLTSKVFLCWFIWWIDVISVSTTSTARHIIGHMLWPKILLVLFFFFFLLQNQQKCSC